MDLLRRGDEKYIVPQSLEELEFVRQIGYRGTSGFARLLSRGMRELKLSWNVCASELGDCYYTGNGVEQDQKEVIKWYQAAAE